MPSVTISRPDLFPNGTSVGIYPPGSKRPGQSPQGPPTAAAIASATVASETVTVTDAAILQGVTYEAYAAVNGENRFLKVRSTLDVHVRPIGAGTFNTSNGSAAITAISPVNSLAVGMRVTGPNIPPDRYVIATPSSSTATLNDGQGVTASTGGAFIADRATPPLVVLGATPRPGFPTSWQGQVRQRRQLMGTAI